MRSLSTLGLLLSLTAAQDTGNHPEWPRWCGKAYMPEYPSFDPGGQTPEPVNLPDGPALYMQFRPRWSIYLEGEAEGHFIVDAQISDWYGEPYPDLDTPDVAPPLQFHINLVSNNDVLIANNITAGTTGKLLSFDLTGLEPSLEPYEVILFGATEHGDYPVTATSELWYLPEKTSGSVTRLDNLNGGLWFRNPSTAGQFEPLLPYGFYGSCDRFLCEDDGLEATRAYRERGLNGMVPLTTVFDSGPVLELMGEIDLRFMYDLRSYYQNLTAVEEQVTAVKDFDGIYAYWGSDEPDGWQHPFNRTVLSRKLIRTIDPYHPVTVTLNCQNYYFKEYTEGADFIMEDTYPIGVNGTYSKWNTPCNTTYGDCGCDNCQGNVQDVSSRLDDLARYERWLGLWPKTKAHNPQAFHGEGYWQRDPTQEEAVAMSALAFHHDAKAIVAWLWPTSDDLAQIHGEFASVVATQPVTGFIVPGKAIRVAVPDLEILDVAYWIQGDQLLLSVVNGGYDPIDEEVAIPLPEEVRPLAGNIEVVWDGGASWEVTDKVRLSGQGAMSTTMVILKLI